jgi:hypothetical protein
LHRSVGFARTVASLTVLAVVNFGLWAIVYLVLRDVLG